MSIRKPRLLDGECREKARLSPLSLSLDMQLFGLSSARMTLPPDAPAVALRDLVELYDELGSVGIFRVTRVEEDVHRIRRIALSHGLCTLADGMSGTLALTGTVSEAMEALLACQPVSRWAVGEVDAPDALTVILTSEYADLLTGLEELLGLLPAGY